METYISLLRGINVGGHRKIKMAELRQMYQDIGFKNVRSYIQSGNLIFQSILIDSAQLEKDIEEAISDNFGYEVPVIVRKKHDWERLFEENPILEESQSINDLFVTFLSKAPQTNLLEKLKSRQTESDHIHVIGNHAFLKIVGPESS